MCVFEGSGVELFRYLIIDEKLEYFVLQGKRPLFRSIEKALTWLYNILNVIKLTLLVFHGWRPAALLKTRVWLGCSVSQAHKTWSYCIYSRICGFRCVGLSKKSKMGKSRKRSRERRYENLTTILQFLPHSCHIYLFKKQKKSFKLNTDSGTTCTLMVEEVPFLNGSLSIYRRGSHYGRFCWGLFTLGIKTCQHTHFLMRPNVCVFQKISKSEKTIKDAGVLGWG